MAIIQSDEKVFMVSNGTNTTYSGSESLKAMQQWYTMQDVLDTVGPGSAGPQGVQGIPGTPGAVGPAGLNWQGSWVSGTSYVADDAVGYDGASWFCILATSGTTAPNLATTNWALLASQGAQGIQGVQGPTGPQGASGGAGTLQQTVDNGNTITASGGTTTTFTGSFIRILNPIYSTGISLGQSALGFIRDNGSGTNKTLNLVVPTNIVDNRTITLPDASGTIALTSDIVAVPKTRGVVYGGTYPNNETVLPYDINIINVGTGNLFKLPDNAPLGKEIIIDCSATVATIYPFSGGGIETAVNGQSGQRNVSFNDLVKFTSFANNYWLAESLQRNAPLLDGKDLSNGNYWSLSWVSNTTSPLSLSTLNSTWVNATTISGFQVFCPSITGGGLVYTKTGAATWVSQPITVVT
jgi:hypothetical protein